MEKHCKQTIGLLIVVLGLMALLSACGGGPMPQPSASATPEAASPTQPEATIQEINIYIIGWIGYYRQANTPSIYEELDGWIRRRLRQMIWKRWKRGTT